MKLFAVIFFVIAVSCIAKADDAHSSCNGIAAVLGPILALLEPFLNGLNGGLQTASTKIEKGVHCIGNTVQDTVSGLGQVVTKTVSGAAGTIEALPATLCQTTEKLQSATGPIIGSVLNSVVGGVSGSH